MKKQPLNEEFRRMNDYENWKTLGEDDEGDPSTSSFQKPSEDSNIENLQKRYQYLDNPDDLEIIANKQNPKLFRLFEPGFDANEIQLGDYIQFAPDEKPDLVFSANERSVKAAYDNVEYSEYSRSRLQKLSKGMS